MDVLEDWRAWNLSTLIFTGKKSIKEKGLNVNRNKDLNDKDVNKLVECFRKHDMLKEIGLTLK